MTLIALLYGFVVGVIALFADLHTFIALMFGA